MHDHINRRLEALIAECQEPLLKEVMTYCAMGEGKRLRPQLLLASYEAVAVIESADIDAMVTSAIEYENTALDFACATEMIHAYSLAHDDLPAMDNDDFRRGRPTCHKAYNEAMAILAGDGLLSLAVEVMARHIDDSSAKSTRAAKALNCIIKAAGVNGMVAGQVSDIINEGRQVSAETLTAIHRRKTGCLITACLEAGAILGGADTPVIQEMAKLGRVLGLAFQIRDDILDVTSTAENLGKPVGSDSKNQKSTYVSVHGMATAEADYRRLSHEVCEIISNIPCKTDALRDLLLLTIERKK